MVLAAGGYKDFLQLSLKRCYLILSGYPRGILTNLFPRVVSLFSSDPVWGFFCFVCTGEHMTLMLKQLHISSGNAHFRIRLIRC